MSERAKKVKKNKQGSDKMPQRKAKEDKEKQEAALKAFDLISNLQTYALLEDDRVNRLLSFDHKGYERMHTKAVADQAKDGKEKQEKKKGSEESAALLGDKKTIDDASEDDNEPKPSKGARGASMEAGSVVAAAIAKDDAEEHSDER